MKRIISTNVCIVGSGFCGYAAYKKLKEKKINATVVEGGDLETPNSKEQQKL